MKYMHIDSICKNQDILFSKECYAVLHGKSKKKNDEKNEDEKSVLKENINK